MKRVDQSTRLGDQFVCKDGGQRRDGNKFPLPPQPKAMKAPLPSQRQGSNRAHNLSVSSRPIVPSYMIGRDRGEE
jgi:hypothetical protein